jgi:hypothetical protein
MLGERERHDGETAPGAESGSGFKVVNPRLVT